MSMRWSATLVSALLLAGCGGGGDSPDARTQPPVATETPKTAKAPTVRRAHCDPDAVDCAEVTGRVLYVEAVDPDGDGDAHYVLAGGNVTLPGVSVVDVAPDLRPRRLPRTGELVSAAGPVFTGSHGQRQIEAVTVNHQRRR
jgi:hypothetical protein